MSVQNQHLDSIEDIKNLMTKSSRFVSLSGLSGISAGVCALIGAAYTASEIECWKIGNCLFDRLIYQGPKSLQWTLFKIGIITFVAAFFSAFLFTYLRSKQTKVPLWGFVARRLMINVAIPMLAGGLLIWRMMDFGVYGLVAPGCLIFYGLALINASKFTLPEIRFLGYGQLILGLINLWMIGYGLYFWAAGFGVLHIIYGIIMWNKYERNK